MEASELRIGNYVWDDYSGEMIVSRLDYSTESCYLRKGWSLPSGFYSLKDVKPIPLTEEWFKRFHTEDQIEKSVRFPNEITIYDRFLFIWKPEYKYWYVVTAYHKEYLTKIEFVHEYQNFILSLTGTELTISGK